MKKYILLCKIQPIIIKLFIGQNAVDKQIKKENPKRELLPITIFLTGNTQVGKSSIYNKLQNLFWEEIIFHPDQISKNEIYKNLQYSNKLKCKYNSILHFCSVLKILKRNRPTYDDRTEEILENILNGSLEYLNSNNKSFWTSEVAEVISKVSQDEKFQEILKSRHKFDIMDSAEYMIKRAKHFDEEYVTEMDILRFD
jgi:hypothetical protein